MNRDHNMIETLREGMRSQRARIAELEAELAAEREANRWIPVEERLPEKGVMVFAYNRNRGSYAFARYKGDYWEAVESSNHWMMAVTHWRPILPPKDGAQ